MKYNTNIIAFLLLLLFTAAVLPPDFFHQFASHHDTTDCRSAGTSIHTQHQHCSSLQLSLPSYTPANHPNEQIAVTVIENKISLPSPVLLLAFIHTAPGRAPPLV